MSVEAFTVHAFTQNKNEGNPAGIVINTNDLTARQMLDIAAQLRYSETAFVSDSDKADFRIRFFTPLEEVPLCGHAVIATFHLLTYLESIDFHNKDSATVTQETNAGILPVICHRDGFVEMIQGHPQFLDIEDNREYIAELLSISAEDILDYPLQNVTTGGVPKLMIPVSSLATLQTMQPDLEEIKKYCQATICRGLYPFTSQTLDVNSDFHARQFNPLAGINEDPLTGVAAGALACYVEHMGISSEKKLVIEQGYILNKGGKMYVDIHDGVKVGGYAAVVGRETLEVI